jgi:hypothetical protein
MVGGLGDGRSRTAVRLRLAARRPARRHGRRRDGRSRRPSTEAPGGGSITCSTCKALRRPEGTEVAVAAVPARSQHSGQHPARRPRAPAATGDPGHGSRAGRARCGRRCRAVAVTQKNVPAPLGLRGHPPAMQALAVGCLEHDLLDREIGERGRVADGSGGQEEQSVQQPLSHRRPVMRSTTHASRRAISVGLAVVGGVACLRSWARRSKRTTRPRLHRLT